MVCLKWGGGLERLESLVTLPELAVGGERNAGEMERPRVLVLGQGGKRVI